MRLYDNGQILGWLDQAHTWASAHPRSPQIAFLDLFRGSYIERGRETRQQGQRTRRVSDAMTTPRGASQQPREDCEAFLTAAICPGVRITLRSCPTSAEREFRSRFRRRGRVGRMRARARCSMTRRATELAQWHVR